MMPASQAEQPGHVSDGLTALRVGQFYFHVTNRRLYCVNEAAREMRDQGLPVLSGDAGVEHLRTAEGGPVSADRLPLAQALREGRPADAEYLLTSPGRADRHLHCSAAPLKDSSGGVVAVAVTLTLSPPLPDWQGLAGLVHDLRTPLHTVGLVVSLLGESSLSAGDREEMLQRLRSAAERAQQIGKELLECCRAPGLKGRGAPSVWFPLEPFLLQMLEERIPDARRKNLTLDRALDPAVGWQVYTDRNRLGRILANLLVNAVRYTAAGGHVTLAAAWQEHEGERFLALGVTDTGAGIAPDEQESIFHPFQRGQSGRDSDSYGSGIGLAVVDQLTQELGLRRHVSSEAGRGSTFRVLVPQRLLRMAPPA
jgi:hypothetical protein